MFAIPALVLSSVVSFRLENNLHCQLQIAVAGNIARHAVEFTDAVAKLSIPRRTRAAANVQDGLRRSLLEGAVIRQERRRAIGDGKAGVREKRQPGVETVELRVVEHIEGFQTQLNVTPAVTAKIEILEQRQVGDIDSRVANERARLRAGIQIRHAKR